MRRRRIFAATAALGLALTTAGVATAVPAEVVREKATYEIVGGVAHPYLYPGDYGFEQCFDELGNPRTYRLHDGTLKQAFTYSYSPSQAAFEAGDTGASMSVEMKAQYKGLFDRDDSGVAIYTIRPQAGGRGSGTTTYNADGTVTNTSTFDFRMEFIDTIAGESTGDYYNIDGTFTEIVDEHGNVIVSTFDGIDDGTCYLHD
jgi:hypothetical protein